ncbi:MAG: calcium-binding protein [Silicimonas sp.]|nr:calcium-binding protein [Silicimonas sp.]
MDNATLKIATAVALILAGSGVALAKGGHGFEGARPTFEELDVDGSGEITAEDFAALRENRFATMDADGSGDVTKDEFTAAAAARAGERAGARFDRLDADGDGVLSRDVLESQRGRGMGARMLSRIDTDNSGGVSAEEFETAMERMGERRGKRKGGHGWGRDHN